MSSPTQATNSSSGSLDEDDEWPPIGQKFIFWHLDSYYLEVTAYDTNFHIDLETPVTDALWRIMKQLNTPGRPPPDIEVPIFFREGPVDLSFIFTGTSHITNEVLRDVIHPLYWKSLLSGTREVEARILEREEWDKDDFETIGIVQLRIREEVQIT